MPSPTSTPAPFISEIADCEGLRMPKSGSMPGTMASSLSQRIPIFRREVPCLAAHPRWSGCASATARLRAPILCSETWFHECARFCRVRKRAALSLRILVLVEALIPSAEATVRRTTMDEMSDLRVISKKEVGIMSKVGEGILRGLEDVLAFIEGRADESLYRVHIPPEIDVKTIRGRLGLTQQEFADRFCFNINTLRQWETGQTGSRRRFTRLPDRDRPRTRSRPEGATHRVIVRVGQLFRFPCYDKR